MLLTSKIFRSRLSAILAAFVFLIGTSGVRGQASGQTDPASEPTILSLQELEKLVGPIALYPDDLLAITLPASTNPMQIVQAARFLEKLKKNPSLKPSEKWDPSVLGLLNYPEVIKVMNEDLDWTWAFGESVVNQQEDVMAAVQQFRAKVYAAENLKSDQTQIIIKEKQIIKIESSDPQVIYVPSYDPQVVVVKHVYTTPVVVYSEPRPVYYSPTAAFFTGMFVGAAIGYGIGWGGGYRGGKVTYKNNVNINTGPRGGGNWNPGNRPGRPGNRPGRPGGGPSVRPGNRPGGPGRGTSARPGTRPGGSGRGTSARPGTRPGGSGKGPSARSGSRPGARTSAKAPRSGGGSFGGYKSGNRAKANSNRGSGSRGISRGGSSRGGSRGSASRSGRSRGGGSRGGGSRGGGRRR